MNPRSQRSSTHPPVGTLAPILIGLAFVMLSRLSDGFVKGFALGGGITLVLLGVVLLSTRMRRSDRPAHRTALWLPSRDEERRR